MNGAVNVLKVHFPRATSDKPTLYVQKNLPLLGFLKSVKHFYSIFNSSIHEIKATDCNTLKSPIMNSLMNKNFYFSYGYACWRLLFVILRFSILLLVFFSGHKSYWRLQITPFLFLPFHVSRHRQ